MAAYLDSGVAATVDGFVVAFCAAGLMDEARVKVGGLGGFVEGLAGAAACGGAT